MAKLSTAEISENKMLLIEMATTIFLEMAKKDSSSFEDSKSTSIDASIEIAKEIIEKSLKQ